MSATTKACLHKRANHQHGTHACYVLDSCRCRPCRTANTAYERMRTRQTAYGRWQPYIDAASARAHVLALVAEGVGTKRIAALSGVSTGVLSKLLYGHPNADGTRRPPTARVRQHTLDRLLSVTAEQLAGGARISSVGTRRRLRALVVVGWSQSKIAAQLGVEAGNFGVLLYGDETTVRTARRVAELYDRLWDTAPPEATHRDKIAASRARNYAQARGWAPPLAWDEDTIDDVGAQPAHALVGDDELDEVMVERIAGGTLRDGYKVSPERIAAIRRLAALSMSDSAIGDRIGMTAAGVLKIRERNGIANGICPAARRSA